MDLVKVTDGIAKPYTYEQFKRDNPLTGWPERAIESVLALHGVFPLRSSMPMHDPSRQVVKEGGITLVGSSWVRQWVVSDIPIEDIRAGASINKGAFCKGLIGLGIIAADEAVSAAKGNWPTSMDAFLSYLPADLAVDVQIEWATEPRISRNNVFVLTLVSWLDGITPEILDTLFGINGA